VRAAACPATGNKVALGSVLGNKGADGPEGQVGKGLLEVLDEGLGARSAGLMSTEAGLERETYGGAVQRVVHDVVGVADLVDLNVRD